MTVCRVYKFPFVDRSRPESEPHAQSHPSRARSFFDWIDIITDLVVADAITIEHAHREIEKFLLEKGRERL